MSRPSLAFFRKEIREISRDRRALLLSFVLPVFVYPATFSLTSSLERHEREAARADVMRVCVTGDAAPLRDALRAEEDFSVIRLEEGIDLRQAVQDGKLEAWVDAPDGIAPRDGTMPEVRIVYYGPHEASADAEQRIRDVLDALRERQARARYADAGGTEDLSALAPVREVDVATQAESGGSRAGRMIPLLLVMTLFIGGSSLSTDLFAGEKERGTLETLYLTPVHRSRIARAKFLVVWSATSITGILNLASLLACYRLGLISDPQDPSAELVLGGGGIVTAFLLVVPLAALVGGALLGISAFARSLKEAQFYVMPVMLVAILPGLLATGQDVRLNTVTALLPLANVALAVRDGLVAPVPWPMLLLVAGASVGWAVLAMRWTTGVLSREDTILGFDPEPYFSRTLDGRRRALWFGMAITVLGFFYVGSLLQARSFVKGLLWSLWGVLPALGLLTARVAWSGGRFADVLSLRPASWRAFVAAPLLGIGLVVPMARGIMQLQSMLIPAPEGLFAPLTDPVEDMRLAHILLLMALSPGVMEEFVFRGVFLGLLRRVGPTRVAVLATAAFFALIHLSVFRFAPTFLVGATFALLVVRSGSLFPSMIAHATYNAVAILVARKTLEPVFTGAQGWVISAAALAVAGALLKPASADPRRPGGSG